MAAIDPLALGSAALFHGVDPSVLTALVQGGSILDLSDSAEVFHQGDAPDAVYVILGGPGSVRIGSMDRRSKALMVEELQPGDIFGEIGVIEGKPRTASATTQGRVRLARISAARFRSALASSPQLAEAVCRMLAKRLRRTFELFQDASFETLEVRLARQILYLAEQSGRVDQRGLRLVRRLRQGDLADLLGATTRSIITILNAWRAAGIVAYDTDRALMTITDRAALEALVQQTQAE